MSTQKALKHFQKTDPLLYRLAKVHMGAIRALHPANPEEYFGLICRSIVGQQLSVKAASTIYGRVLAALGLTDANVLSPSDFDKITDEQLRLAGLSYQKIGYIRSIVGSVENQTIKLDSLATRPDEEVINELVQLRGIGRWSAEMFLMSALAREDVFSAGDLGLMTAAANLYGLDRKAEAAEIIEKINLSAPYRTYASFVLWQSLDNT